MLTAAALLELSSPRVIINVLFNKKKAYVKNNPANKATCTRVILLLSTTFIVLISLKGSSQQFSYIILFSSTNIFLIEDQTNKKGKNK